MMEWIELLHTQQRQILTELAIMRAAMLAEATSDDRHSQESYASLVESTGLQFPGYGDTAIPAFVEALRRRVQ